MLTIKAIEIKTLKKKRDFPKVFIILSTEPGLGLRKNEHEGRNI